jgi:hypothetical protein
MDEPKPDFWFPVKRLGWGWGAPVRWQGWALLIAYVVMAAIGVMLLQSSGTLFRLLYLVVITILFVVVVATKGERPLKWRDGE